MKFKLLFIFLSIQFITLGQRRDNQETGTVLVQLEKLLPNKTYDYTNSDILVKWHLLILDLIEQTPNYTPNVAARSMAYINLAAFHAVLPKYPNLNSLEGQIQEFILPNELKFEDSTFVAPVALNMAIFTSIDEFFIGAPYVWMEKCVALKDTINSQFSRQFSEDQIQKAKNFGFSIAKEIYTYSKNDGGDKARFRTYDLGYKVPKCESCFEINRVADLENTGPLHPNWGKNRTFLSANSLEWDIKPKHSFGKYRETEFYKEAMEVYKTSKECQPGSEKNAIANFWDDAATYSYTAVGHSVSILTQVLRTKPMRLDSAASTYVTLTLGLNDAMIACWGLKYKYQTIRPVTYIKRYINSGWEPIILTPPFPEFPSGHSTQSATMATILTQILGENTSYTDYSKFWVGKPKVFKNFWESANETSISRLYGGIHFRDALEQGQELGRRVGKNVNGLKTFK
ncbi:MAG: vanadium-dependent haloperoxidase [Leadbetterella sp.]